MFFQTESTLFLGIFNKYLPRFLLFSVFKGKLSCDRANLDEGGGETYPLNSQDFTAVGKHISKASAEGIPINLLWWDQRMGRINALSLV